ncbi:MAG TPA: hypothetical protein VGH28_04965 [Polyangiaceae bacterium]|jgi:hypothetical protein
MTTRRRNVLVLLGVLALAIGGAFFLAPAASQPAAIDAIPSGAFLVVTADLVALRASPLAKDLGGLREVSDVAELCGFDPLAHAKSVAIGVPEKPDGVFGLAITSDLARGELVHCAERVMSARSAMPSVTEHGSWTVLEQEGFLAEATRPRIAYRDGAPLLVARGDYLATMQAALDGRTQRAGASGHAALRARAPKDALFIATAILPKSVRDRIGREVSDETDTSDSQKKTMSAILSVNAVSLAIAPTGDLLEIDAELDCDTEDACGVVRDFIDRKRKSIAAEPAARFAGIAGLLDALRLESKGPSLALRLKAPESEIARAVRVAVSSAFAPPPRPKPIPSGSPSGFSPGR